MPRVVNIDHKKQEFVEASRGLIAREGLGAATLRKVSAEAGVTTGALTHYFSDRAELLIETLRAAHFATAERMTRAVLLADTPYTRLRAILLESLPLDEVRLQEWRVWIAFWAAAVEDPVLKQENSRRYEEWRDLIVEGLTPFFHDPDILNKEAAMLVAHVDGLGLRITLANSPEETASAQVSGQALIDNYLELAMKRGSGGGT